MNAEEKIQEFVINEYKIYIGDVKKYLDIVEAYFAAIPKGLLNEVRNFVGHISSAVANTDDSYDIRVENINNAHSHLRRVLLDVNLRKEMTKAENLFIEAKHADKTGKNSSVRAKYSFSEDASMPKKFADELDPVYEKYLKAYNQFCDVEDYIELHYDGVVRLARKHIVSKILSVLGWIIAIIVSIVFSLI